MLASALELSVVVVIMKKKGNGQRFKMPLCTLGNVASARWACCCFVSVESRCCVWGFTAGVVIVLSVQICILASYWSRCRLQVFAAVLVFVVDFDTVTPSPILTHTHTYWMPHSPILQICQHSTAAPQTLWQYTPLTLFFILLGWTPVRAT